MAKISPVGDNLRNIWSKARGKLPDAMWAEVTGRTNLKGELSCDTKHPAAHGWRYKFYSPRKNKFVMIADCHDNYSYPMVSSNSGSTEISLIEGKFIDYLEAQKILKTNEISLEVNITNASNKIRPITWTLKGEKNSSNKKTQVFWKIRAGLKIWKIERNFRKLWMGYIAAAS